MHRGFAVTLFALLPVIVMTHELSRADSPAAQETLVPVITDPGQGPVTIENDAGYNARELSGITWLGGDRYLAVSDKERTLAQLTVELEPATAKLRRVTAKPSTKLSHGADLEGIVYLSNSNSLVISDELGSLLREHSLDDGSLVQPISVPAIFKRFRPNLSFEALALHAPTNTLWVANEEALAVDGPSAKLQQPGSPQGSVVRLQKFDAQRNPAGQWAYVTDGAQQSGWIAIGSSGVSDLLALPTGQLLVLERAVGITLSAMVEFRHRIYLVDFTNASDTSENPGFAENPPTPVSKHLLWQGHHNNANFEGITLGPRLSHGEFLLLLVSDNGHFTLPGPLTSIRAEPGHVVLPLRLRPGLSTQKP